jgi:hypothetical protein
MSSVDTFLWNIHPTVGHLVSRVMNLGMRIPRFNSIILRNTTAATNEYFNNVFKNLPFWGTYKSSGIDLVGLNENFERSNNFFADKHGLAVMRFESAESKPSLLTDAHIEYYIIDGDKVTKVNRSDGPPRCYMKLDPHIVIEQERNLATKNLTSNGMKVIPLSVLGIGWTCWWDPKPDIIAKVLDVNQAELERLIDDFMRTKRIEHTIPFLFTGCPLARDEHEKIVPNPHTPVDAIEIMSGSHATHLHVVCQYYGNQKEMVSIIETLIKKALIMIENNLSAISSNSSIEGKNDSLFLTSAIQFKNFSYETSYGNFIDVIVTDNDKDSFINFLRDYSDKLSN